MVRSNLVTMANEILLGYFIFRFHLINLENASYLYPIMREYNKRGIEIIGIKLT